MHILRRLRHIFAHFAEYRDDTGHAASLYSTPFFLRNFSILSVALFRSSREYA